MAELVRMMEDSQMESERSAQGADEPGTACADCGAEPVDGHLVHFGGCPRTCRVCSRAVPQGAAAEPTRDGAIPEGFLLVKASVWDALRQSLASAEARAESLTEDAERWRAFLGSERIRFFGTAGPHDGYAHFGGEFWTQHPDAHTDATKANREFLIRYADTARAALSPSPSEPAR